MKSTALRHQKDYHADYMREWRAKHPRFPVWVKSVEERASLLKALAKFREKTVQS